MQQFASKREFLKYAQEQYSMSWDTILAILKESGYAKWDGNQVKTYLDALTDYSVKQREQERQLFEDGQEKLSTQLLALGEEWGLSSDDVQRLRRQYGWIVLEPECWNEYTAKIRFQFDLKQLNAQKNKLQFQNLYIVKLMELARQKEIVVPKDGGSWYYTGSKEVMDAHWELQQLLREKNQKNTIAKWQPLPID